MTPTHVTSADGTRIAMETVGDGPPMILTTGALQDRASVRMLAGMLAHRVTVHSWDRRGRGDSDGTPDPHLDPVGADRETMVAAEVADLAAVVARAGGTPAHYAHSAGAVLVLEAAMHGVPASRIVAHEPPWRLGGPDPGERRDLAAATLAALRGGRPDDAAAATPVPVAELRATPFWARTAAMAPSLPHELALVRGGLPGDRLAALRVPLLALDGDESAARVIDVCAALAAAVPGAEHRTLPGEDHHVLPSVLAPVILEFLDR